MEHEGIVAPTRSQWNGGPVVTCFPSESLSLLQRILLATDGTVSCILEQYAGEEIEVVKLAQALGPAGCDDPQLGFTDVGSVLTRTVLLRGSRSGRHLLYAESALRTDVLGPELVDALLSSDVAIGVLFRQHRLETFREIVASGQEPAGRCAVHFGLPSCASLVFRRYRIFVSGTPSAVITEKFPLHGALSRAG